MPVDVLEIAQKLISYASVTPEDNGALPYVSSLLQSYGFETTPLVFAESGTATVENLFARYGDKAPLFCFAGHTDVVPPGDLSAWSVSPFSPVIRDGKLIGRGAADMKAAIAAFMVAAIKFVRKYPELPGSIGFLLTGDEEGIAVNGTKKMLLWLQENAVHIDACVVGEPTNPSYLGEMVKIGRRGSMTFKVTIHGKQGHVAYPHLADNPVRRLVRLLHNLDHKPLDEGTPYFQPSNLEITTIDVGNSADNVIPPTARVVFNIRFNNLHKPGNLEKWVRSLCDSVVENGDARYEMSVRVSGEAFLTEPGSLSELAIESVRDITGNTPELSTTGGTSDARFIKDYCPVVEFGLINATAHHIDEQVSVADIVQLEKIYYRMLERFFK
jgi:succinyl-diaminopimelate desuccinylase